MKIRSDISFFILLVLSEEFSYGRTYIPYIGLYRRAGFSEATIRMGVRRLLEAGLIEKVIKNGRAYVRLTSRGEECLRNLTPQAIGEKWDGIWRIIIDPKLLNSAIKIDFKPTKLARRDSLIIETKAFASRGNREVAESVWRLGRLENMYLAWIRKAKLLSMRQDQRYIIKQLLDYRTMMHVDPKLPKQLLPRNWPAERARQLFFSLAKKIAKRQ